MSKDASKKQCFVVSPIGKAGSEARINADWLLDGIIKPVITAFFSEFQIIRADTIAAPGLIDSQIIRPLLEAELVIADLTGLNPNVFYEIGIRHVMQLPIVHMHRDGEPIPFDVSIFRSIPYSRETFQQVEQAKIDLKTTLDAVFVDGYEVENPVTRTQEKITFRNNASPNDRILFDEIQNISVRMERLEALGMREHAHIDDFMRRQEDLLLITIIAPPKDPIIFDSFVAKEIKPFFHMVDFDMDENRVKFRVRVGGTDMSKIDRLQRQCLNLDYDFSLREIPDGRQKY